jgi:hypothetical protein
MGYFICHTYSFFHL